MHQKLSDALTLKVDMYVARVVKETRLYRISRILEPSFFILEISRFSRIKKTREIQHHYSCDFEVNQTKNKGGCQSGRKVIPHDSKSDLPLNVQFYFTSVGKNKYSFISNSLVFYT